MFVSGATREREEENQDNKNIVALTFTSYLFDPPYQLVYGFDERALYPLSSEVEAFSRWSGLMYPKNNKYFDKIGAVQQNLLS